MKSAYLQSVLDKIENKAARAEIGEELESHLLDKRDYYMELGYTEEEAARRAEEEMGDPDDCAVPLNGLHSMRGKTPLRMITLLFLSAFLAAAVFSTNIFCYGSEHLLAVFHSIGIDLLSTGFIVGFAVILLHAYKKKDKLIAAGVAICLTVYSFISLINNETQSFCGLFQPAVFAAFTLFTKGFNGYADRIFAYQYTPWEEKPVFAVGAAVIFAVLLVWAVALFLSVHLQERLHGTKALRKVHKALRAAVSVLLCANFILITAGVIAAAIDLPNKRAAAEKEKREIINLVLDSYADWQNFVLYGQDRQYLRYYTIESQDFTQTQSYLLNPATNNTLLLTGSKNDDVNPMVTYGFSLTNFSTDLPLLSHDIRLTEHERQQLSDIATLDDFIKLNWYDKAVSVMRTQGSIASSNTIETTRLDTIVFTFLTDGNSTTTYTFSLENGNKFTLIHDSSGSAIQINNY